MACHRHCASPDVIASRRSFIAGVACTAIVPGAAFAQLSGPGSDADVRFMRMAIEEARQGDFPFGAVIVRDGAVIARGRNLGRTISDPTAHGEMVAIRRGLADHGPAALRGSTLYTSGESCAMCMGAIIWCGIGRVVFGASITQLATKIGQIMVTNSEIAGKTPFLDIAITGGVLAEESMKLFK